MGENKNKDKSFTFVNEHDRLLLTIPEVAARLGMGRSFVYQLVLKGEIPSIKLGRARRVPAGAVEQFIKDRMKATDSQEDEH